MKEDSSHMLKRKNINFISKPQIMKKGYVSLHQDGTISTSKDNKGKSWPSRIFYFISKITNSNF